jgi:hypothetical protein
VRTVVAPLRDMTDPCPYCKRPVELADSSKIYGRSYGMVYICTGYPSCDAYVGVHKGTDRALGRLANRELREAKKAAHAAFDVLWMAKIRIDKVSKRLARNAGYRWLAEQMGMPREICHIGMFDVDECKRVVEISRPHLVKS